MASIRVTMPMYSSSDSSIFLVSRIHMIKPNNAFSQFLEFRELQNNAEITEVTPD